MPILSWTTGWINVSGWIALVASGGLLGSQLIIGIISMYSPSYVPERWHQFLIFIGYTLTAFLVNAFMNVGAPVLSTCQSGRSHEDPQSTLHCSC